MFIKKYPDTSNHELARYFGIDKKNVEYLGRKFRLRKSRKFLQASWIKCAMKKKKKKES